MVLISQKGASRHYVDHKEYFRVATNCLFTKIYSEFNGAESQRTLCDRSYICSLSPL